MKTIPTATGRLTYLDTVADCQWLRETALKRENLPFGYVIPAFQSAIINGNEDCPTRITLYTQQAPLVTDSSIADLVLRDDGTYLNIKGNPSLSK